MIWFHLRRDSEAEILYCVLTPLLLYPLLLYPLFILCTVLSARLLYCNQPFVPLCFYIDVRVYKG